MTKGDSEKSRQRLTLKHDIKCRCGKINQRNMKFWMVCKRNSFKFQCVSCNGDLQCSSVFGYVPPVKEDLDEYALLDTAPTLAEGMTRDYHPPPATSVGESSWRFFQKKQEEKKEKKLRSFSSGSKQVLEMPVFTANGDDLTPISSAHKQIEEREGTSQKENAESSRSEKAKISLYWNKPNEKKKVLEMPVFDANGDEPISSAHKQIEEREGTSQKENAESSRSEKAKISLYWNKPNEKKKVLEMPVFDANGDELTPNSSPREQIEESEGSPQKERDESSRSEKKPKLSSNPN